MVEFEKELREYDRGLGPNSVRLDEWSSGKQRSAAEAAQAAAQVAVKAKVTAKAEGRAKASAAKVARDKREDQRRKAADTLTLVERRLGAIIGEAEQRAGAVKLAWELRFAALLWAHLVPDLRRDFASRESLFASHIKLFFETLEWPAECERLEDVVTRLLGAAPLLESQTTALMRARSGQGGQQLADVGWVIENVAPALIQSNTDISLAAVIPLVASVVGFFRNEAGGVFDKHLNLSQVARAVVGWGFPKVKRLLVDSDAREEKRRLLFLDDAAAEPAAARSGAAKGAAMSAAMGAESPGSNMGWLRERIRKAAENGSAPARALRIWAQREVDIFSALAAESIASARREAAKRGVPPVLPAPAAVAGAKLRPLRDAATAAGARGGAESSKAFAFGLRGAIAADAGRVHKGVKLLDCALYDEETDTQVGRLISNPTVAEWRTLKNAWQKRDAATRDASGVREQIVQTLRVRPTLLKKKGDPPPAYAERHKWFPARIALPDALPDGVASAAHDARFEKRLANGTVWIRYVTDVLPTFGSTDNVLLIKQNKNVKDVAGKELLTGELKFVGLTIDPEFHSPDNVTITVSECAEEEEEGDDDDDDEARRARRSNPPLREHAANRVTVSVKIAVRDTTVTLNADPENVEVCLGNPAMNGLFNWLQSWATVFGPAPLPIVFPSVSLDVDLKGPFFISFVCSIFWLTHTHILFSSIARPPRSRSHRASRPHAPVLRAPRKRRRLRRCGRSTRGGERRCAQHRPHRVHSGGGAQEDRPERLERVDAGVEGDYMERARARHLADGCGDGKDEALRRHLPRNREGRSDDEQDHRAVEEPARRGDGRRAESTRRAPGERGQEGKWLE